MENPEDPFKIETEKAHSSKKIAVAGICILLSIAVIAIILINPFKSSTSLTPNSLPKNTTSVLPNNTIHTNKTITTNSSITNKTASCKNETIFLNKTATPYNNTKFVEFIIPNKTYEINISQPNATQYLTINLSVHSERNVSAGILTSGGLANAIRRSPIEIKFFSIIYFGNISENYSINENITKLPVGENYIVFYNQNATFGVPVEINHLSYTYRIKKQECVLAKQ